MKYFPIFFFFALGLYFSCNDAESTANNGTSNENEPSHENEPYNPALIDSSLLQRIESTFQIDKTKTYDISLVGKDDKLVVTPAEGNLSRIDLKLYTDDAEQWSTFYVNNEEVFMFRFREWIKAGKSSARETLNYFNKDKIIYAEEKYMDLAPGTPPMNLRMEKSTVSKRDRKEINAEFQKYWGLALKEWRKQKNNQ